jgi:hypothetical protein
MTSTVETATQIRPFHIDVPEEALDDLHRRLPGDALARQGDRHRSLRSGQCGNWAAGRG